LSDHQPDNSSDLDSASATAPGEGHRDPSQRTANDLPEPDFSRLRLALASLDGAFPER